MRSPLVKRIFFSLSLILLISTTQAQSDLVFYHSGDQLNSPNLNPAFLTAQNKFTFSVFPIAGINVGYNNQHVINNMILDVIRGNETKDKFKEVFRSMLKLGLFYQRMEIPLFNFGYNSKIGSFNFRIMDNMRLMTNFKGEFSDFLSNPSSLTITLNRPQTFPVHAMYYREYSLGYAKELIKNKLSVGFRAKIYFGKFSMISDVQGNAVQKADSNYYFQTSNQLKLSFPAKIILNGDNSISSFTTAADFTPGNFMLNSKNSGLGFDLGFNYQINPDLALSASAIDVGKINWKNNLNSMNYVGEYPFPQEYVNTSKSDHRILTRTNNFAADTTSIPELFQVKISPSSYSTNMPVTFYTALKYRASSGLNIGVVDRLIKTKNMGYNSFSITGEFEVTKKLSMITGYAIQGNSYANIPFALVYSWEAGQYFVGTDNFLSFIPPTFSDFSGISFGVSFYLFRKKAKNVREIDYLPFFELKKRRNVS